MAWAKNGTPDTLTTSGDTITISDLTATTFMQEMLHVITTGGAVSQRLTFNSDTGSNYAQRRSADGGSDATGTSGVNIDAFNDDLVTNSGGFTILYTVNIATQEKLAIVFAVSQEASGAGTAPTRDEGVFKWANTSNQITRIDHNNNKAGSYDTDSNLTALGSDGVESMTVQDGAVYYDTDLNKEYVLYNNTWTEL